MLKAAKTITTIAVLVFAANELLPAVNYIKFNFFELPRIEAFKACGDPAINRTTHDVVTCMKIKLGEE